MVKPDLLHQEIFQQPEVLDRVVREESGRAEALARAIRERGIPFAVIAGRGSSDNAALYARYVLEIVAGLPVSLAAPSVFTLYRRPPRLDGALVVGVSQSGRSPDICRVVMEGRRQGAVTLAVVNDPDSPLARVAEHVLLCHAGPELSVPATKTYTAQLTLFALLAAHLAGDQGLMKAIASIPDRVARTLRLESEVQGFVQRYRYMERCIVIGRGYNMATAMEVGLKIKETSYVLAEPYSVADFLHGPIALVEPGFPVLMVAPDGATFDNLLDIARDLRDKKAELIVFSDRREALDLATRGLRMPSSILEELSPVPYAVAGQLFAYHLALAKGLEPAAPRSLKKVTTTL